MQQHYFQIRSHSELLGVKTLTYEYQGVANSTHNTDLQFKMDVYLKVNVSSLTSRQFTSLLFLWQSLPFEKFYFASHHLEIRYSFVVTAVFRVSSFSIAKFSMCFFRSLKLYLELMVITYSNLENVWELLGITENI